MTKRRKHWLWTIEEKRTICLQARTPGVSVAQVARRYAPNANLIFKWLRDPRFAPSADALETTAEEPLFLPMDVRAEPTSPPVLATGQPDGEIEIALLSGHRVKVCGAFDGEAVARLLKVLAQS